MLSSILLKSFTYSFSSTAAPTGSFLHKRTLSRYFNKSQQTFNKSKQLLQSKLNIEQKLSTNQLIKVFKQHPKIFVDGTRPNKQIQSRVNFIKELSKKYQLANVMLKYLYKNKYILFKMDDQTIKQLCQLVQDDLKLTKEQIHKIFTNYYRLINPKLKFMIDEKISLFQEYLHLQQEQIIKLFIKSPFLIPASSQRIKQSIKLLLTTGKQLNNSELLSLPSTIKFLHQHSQVFLLGRQQIKDTVKLYKDWGMQQQQIWQILLQKPVLFNNFPYEVMPLKKKLFRYFKFTKQMGRKMIRQYPLVLMSSISSLQTKLIFIRDRLKLPINQQCLELLQYKFSDIRPRGQLIVRSKLEITLKSFVEEYLKITDQQFCKKIDIQLSRFNQEKQRFKQTQELDFRRRKILDGSDVNTKIKGYINGLRQELKKEVVV